MTTHFFKPAGLPYSYYTTKQGNDMSFQVVLPNGRNPNGRKLKLDSKEGADEFVDTLGTDFMSTSLAASDDQELKFAYMLIQMVADNASPEKIASGIPESELRTFIEHTRNTLHTLSSNRNWIRSGTVSMRHEFLFKTVACFSAQPSLLKIFLSNEGMEAVAKFYASRKKNEKPNKSVADLVLNLVNNACYILTHEGLSFEKVFFIMEKAGLLGQFIRCVPVDPESSANIVRGLQTCLQLVKKKLKSGTPTGDILDAVIAGKDGPINEKAKSSLARLQSLALLSNYECDAVKSCRNCEKTETQMDNALLMKCQRCKIAYYCSKECQVADWKSHKKVCKALASGNESRPALKTAHNTIAAFIDSNYFEIAKEIYKKTQEFNVPETDLLIEIDFFGDAPALRNEFKVWLISGFLEGSSVVDAPDWFHTYDKKKSFERFFREKVTSDHLLALCRTGNGAVSIGRLNRPGA
jgi:hypothetical protein